MEKRNFVTSGRTTEGAAFGDELIGSAAGLFDRTTAVVKDASDFEKRASVEDEKSDKSDSESRMI